MKKPNRISHSAIRTFTQCGRKYKFHYIDRLRSKTTSGALIFGSSIDKSLNELLETKDLDKAIKAFDKSFRYNFINNEGHYLPESTLVVYAKRDFDKDLLQSEDIEQFNKFLEKEGLYDPTVPTDINEYYKTALEDKEHNGLNNLTSYSQKVYALSNWLSMRRKGHVMLKSYNKEILPKIREVIAVQKSIAIENDQNDKITGFLDLVVEWQDGKRYLFDNKTSSMEYEKDSAMTSQQLIIYYHAVKEEYKLDGVGFIVMYKQLLKNKTKKCSSCGKNGTGQRHKTCDAEIMDRMGSIDRCNSDWIETIDPECRIEVILNEVTTEAEDLVIQTFDEANEGIKKEAFGPNLEACNNGFKCQFYNKCWKGDDSDLIKLEKKNEDKSN